MDKLVIINIDNYVSVVEKMQKYIRCLPLLANRETPRKSIMTDV